MKPTINLSLHEIQFLNALVSYMVLINKAFNLSDVEIVRCLDRAIEMIDEQKNPDFSSGLEIDQKK